MDPGNVGVFYNITFEIVEKYLFINEKKPNQLELCWSIQILKV